MTSIKERFVESGYLQPRIVAVRYCEEIPDFEIKRKLIGDLSYPRDYLFFAVAITEDLKKVFYGKNHRHEEFDRALRQEFEQEPDEVLQGQIKADEDGTFYAITFHNIPDEEETQKEIIHLIIRGITPQLWSDRVVVEIKKNVAYIYYFEGNELVSH